MDERKDPLIIINDNHYHYKTGGLIYEKTEVALS